MSYIRLRKKGDLGEAMFHSIQISFVFAAIKYKPMGTLSEPDISRLTENLRSTERNKLLLSDH